MQDVFRNHSTLVPCLCLQRLAASPIVATAYPSEVCISYLPGEHLRQFFKTACALDPTEACLCRSKRSRSRDRESERPKRSRHDRSHHSRDRASPATDKQHAEEEEREGGSTAATSAPAFVPKAQPKGLVVVKAKKFDGCYSQLVDAMLDSQPHQVGHQGCNPLHLNTCIAYLQCHSSCIWSVIIVVGAKVTYAVLWQKCGPEWRMQAMAVNFASCFDFCKLLLHTSRCL